MCDAPIETVGARLKGDGEAVEVAGKEIAGVGEARATRASRRIELLLEKERADAERAPAPGDGLGDAPQRDEEPFRTAEARVGVGLDARQKTGLAGDGGGPEGVHVNADPDAGAAERHAQAGGVPRHGGDAVLDRDERPSHGHRAGRHGAHAPGGAKRGRSQRDHARSAQTRRAPRKAPALMRRPTGAVYHRLPLRARRLPR